MSIQVAICKEHADNEYRVAATPETVKKMVAAGLKITVQKGAGEKSSYIDQAYKDAGASIATDSAKAVKNADILLCVGTPQASTLKALPKKAVIIGALNPHNFDSAAQKECKAQNLTAMAMELMPRITRAQSMDILSSQANLAGYRAVIDAAHEFGRAFPMMMTAAGTISPARVFIMGAGVAGLQAIATAKRLGAIVSATDVRLAAKEQVESLGANFVMVENEESQAAETEGGYAKEMSAAYKKAQAKLVAETIAKQDIVITTALIPGKPAPELVNEDMVKSMKPGSVIVDLATPQGGNCSLSEAGKIVQKHDVRIIGFDNTASRVAVDASALYARNLWNYVQILLNEDKSALALNMEDELQKAVTLFHEGTAVHDILGGTKPAKKAAPKKKKATPKTTKKAAEKTDTPTKPANVKKASTKAAAKKPVKKAGTSNKKTAAPKSKKATKDTAQKADTPAKPANVKKADDKAHTATPAKKAGTSNT